MSMVLFHDLRDIWIVAIERLLDSFQLVICESQCGNVGVGCVCVVSSLEHLFVSELQEGDGSSSNKVQFHRG